MLLRLLDQSVGKRKALKQSQRRQCYYLFKTLTQSWDGAKNEVWV